MATFDITDFGATGDGVMLDTQAINAAITACAEAGGGQVRVSPGTYVSGSILMKSGVTLFLAAGARIVGTNDLNQYHIPAIRGRYSKWHRGLIIMENLHDVCICGPGLIDGQKVFDPDGEENMRGPHAISAYQTVGIRIHDVNFIDAANYAMMFTSCDDVDVNNVTVEGGWDGVHSRGTAQQHSRNLTVTNSRFFTGDDCIAGAYVDQILVNNCVLNTACNGIRWIGPGKHMLFSNLTIYGGSRNPHRTTGRMVMLAGITIQPGAWGPMPGELDDIHIHNVTMHKIGAPIWLLLKEDATLAKVEISNIVATDMQIGAVVMESWVDNPIEHVTIRDCDFSYGNAPVTEAAGDRLEFPSFDIRPVPAWGLQAKNVTELYLDNVRLSGPAGDVRPAIIAEDVDKLYRRNVRTFMPGKEPEQDVDTDIDLLTWS